MRFVAVWAQEKISEGVIVMPSVSLDELKRQALEVFGRELSDQQLEIYKGRLPTMLQNVRLLEDWGGRLEKAHPAQVQCPLAIQGGDKDEDDG